MDATLKEAHDGLADFKKSAIGQQVKQWQKIVDDAEKPVKAEIKNVVKTNGTLITRFWHRPDNMIVNVRAKTSAKGYINWQGQSWNWELNTVSMPAHIQKRVKLIAQF